MPDRYAVIGNPVQHSKSPQIHAAFARQTGEDIEYTRLLAPEGGFRDAVAAFRAGGGKGLNVTLPFKLEAAAIATRLSERARRAGAANFLRFDESGMAADNTDGVGLARDLAGNLGAQIAGARLLLVGAGGAARGVMQALLDAAPVSLHVVNRTADRARALAKLFADPARAVQPVGGGLVDVGGLQFDLVINATSAGIAGEVPALAQNIFAAGSLAYDMVYGAGPTAFMKFAQAQGCGRAADGLGMLVEQAAESFFLWRGVRPETAPVLAHLREHRA